MNLLLALSLIAAPGDILLAMRTNKIELSSGQRTTLGNGVVAQWPQVPLADIVSFRAERTASGPVCSVLHSETLTASSLFSLLVSGESISRGAAATARTRWLGPEACGASLASAIGTLVSALAPGATTSAVRSFDCTRNGGIFCHVVWSKSHTQAQAFTLLQTGATLVPLGVE